MQSTYCKYVPRLRAFEKLSGPAFQRLKADWEKSPGSVARCKNADSSIWLVFDQRCNVWVTVYLLLSFCDCGSSDQVCHHQQLARHAAKHGNNPATTQHNTSMALQRHAVYAAQNRSTSGACTARCYEAELSKLFTVSMQRHSMSCQMSHDQDMWCRLTPCCRIVQRCKGTTCATVFIY